MNDYGMRSFEMWSRSAGEAQSSHCWARSSHEPHIRTHSWKNTGDHAPHYHNHMPQNPIP